jgi:hypothetical protein
MQPPRKIAVAGATGRVGHHIVDVLQARGHDVVPMSRSQGVDVITGKGLAAALAQVECIIDAATGPSSEQEAATTFFTTAARNLHHAGQRAGVRRMIVVSIIGTDRFTAGYGAAKIAHEPAMRAGPIPVHVLRAAQFHEFVAQLVDWGTQGDVSHVPEMRTQLVAARARRRGTRRPGHQRPGHQRPGHQRPGHRTRTGPGAVLGGRRPVGGEPGRDGDAARLPARSSLEDRGRERSGRPKPRAQRERCPASGPGRHPRRPHV